MKHKNLTFLIKKSSEEKEISISEERRSLIEDLNIKKYMLSWWENEVHTVPLKHFIKLKRLYPNLDPSYCPAYQELFQENEFIKKNYPIPHFLLKNPEKVRVSL